MRERARPLPLPPSLSLSERKSDDHRDTDRAAGAGAETAHRAPGALRRVLSSSRQSVAVCARGRLRALSSRCDRLEAAAQSEDHRRLARAWPLDRADAEK